MKSTPIVALLRFCNAGSSRRDILAGLSGGLLAVSPLALVGGVVTAKKGKRHQKKRKRNQAQNPAAPPPSPPGPITRADATCAGGDDAGVAADGDDRVSQTFTAITSGALVRAELQINKLEESFGDYILHLGTVDAFAVPTNEVLAATSVANFAVPAGESTVTFTFANPASVVSGIQYALVLTRPGSNQLVWRGHSGDTCAGRAFVSPAQTTTFSPLSAEDDLNFTTFVAS